jgi:UDP-N-acetylmuramyl pentapeptide synthase
MHYPFWLLLAQDETPMGFSSIKGVEAFVKRHREKKWDIRLINRYSMPFVLKGLREDGHQYVRFDAAADGTGWESVTLEELQNS